MRMVIYSGGGRSSGKSRDVFEHLHRWNDTETIEQEIPISDLMTRFNEIIEENEKLAKELNAMTEKYKEAQHNYRSTSSKYTNLMAKTKSQIREELEDEIGEDIRKEYASKFRHDTEDTLMNMKKQFINQAQKLASMNSEQVDDFSNRILKELEDEYTRYLDTSDNESDRALGYLIALRKYKKIAEKIIKERKPIGFIDGEFVYREYRFL